MKNLCAVAFLAILTGSPSSAFTSEEKDLICPQMGELAEQIMILRQKGIPMSKVITALKNDEKTVDEVIRSMITAAYARPQFQTDKVIQQTTAEFRNIMEYECYK